jgi:uncharacterized protein (TIGR03118 family)
MSSWFHRLRTGSHTPARPRARYRPAVEHLEDRCVLSFLGYLQTNLVSDIQGLAKHTDPNLINPWGLSYAPGGVFWVSNNNSGTSTLKDGHGIGQGLIVHMPAPPSSPPGSFGTPDGNAFNPTNGFAVSENGQSGASAFLFATEDGTILGWSPGVDLTHGIIAVDNSTNPTAADGAVYKGLAIGKDSMGHTLIYATNFRHATVDVFNEQFQQVDQSAFQDPKIPTGYAPFGIQNIDGNLFVTYAKQNAQKHDDVEGLGHGFVDEFTTDGQLVRRFASRGALDSPWGLALAPNNFGPFSHDLLIGNLGNDRINAFNLTTGALEGTVSDIQGNPITIGDLWGLKFGNGGSGGPQDTLFFSAGIGEESHGLFGSISAIFRNQPAAPRAAADSDAATSALSDTTIASLFAAQAQHHGTLFTNSGSNIGSNSGLAGAVFSEADAWMAQHAMTGDLATGVEPGGAVHAHAVEGADGAGLDNAFADS